jgi:Concanavalin A-like lectin/glucanases superfamily
MWPAVQHTLGNNLWFGVKVRRTASMAVGNSGNTIINWTDPVFDTDGFWSGTDRTFNTGASVNTGTDVITLDSAHGWTTGQAVWYQKRMQPNNEYQTAVSKTASLKFYVPGTEMNNAYERVRNVVNNAPTSVSFGYPDGLSTLGYRAIRFTATNGGTSWTKDPTNLRDDFTLECWFNSTATLATSTNFYHPAALMMSDISGVQNDYGLGIGGAMKPVFGTGNPDQFITASGTYNDGNWHHVVATRTKTSGAVEIWVDGVSRATGTMTNRASLPAESVYWTGMNYVSFVGGVAHLAAYNTVLNSTTIGQHYTLGSAGARTPDIGLTDNTLYYARSIAADQVALYTSASNATNDVSRINLTSGGNETHYLSVDPSRLTVKKAGLYQMNLTGQTTSVRLGGNVIERYNSSNVLQQGSTLYVNESSSGVPKFLNNHATFKMDAGDYIKCWARGYVSGTLDVVDDTPTFWMYKVG